MARFDLSQLEWTLYGWRPFAWRMGKRIESQLHIAADIGPIHAHVPGSVQRALFDAGLIPDWNIGLNSLDCEWIEHRHWDFNAWIEADMIPADEPIVLYAPALDYAGWVLVDCAVVCRFEGALVPHRFDLTEALGDGKRHLLSIVFEEPPREQGQIGYTSLSRCFKPRYNYSWDWCPRIVPVGAWEPLTLLSGADAAYEILSVRTRLGEDNATGTVLIHMNITRDNAVQRIESRVLDNDRVIAHSAGAATPGESVVAMKDISVAPWWPNGAGRQQQYTLIIEAYDSEDGMLWTETRQIGFKRIEWRPCEDAPADAEPWLCVVNGKPIFLQGANWTPPKAIYHDVTREDYVRLIELYKAMGANILRVWGGGILEKHDFYDLCDQAGILVWQELPLSSSGIENCPPYERDTIETLCRIARHYAQQRGHHVSLLLWSGGNELTWGGPGEKSGITPVDESHPCIASLRDTLAACDPDHRFIATSPTGPRFCADAKEYGKGMHHDIHGPWGLGGFEGDSVAARIEAWRNYWENDDSLFRSEAGMPGAASAECITRYGDLGRLWPPQGVYWMHTAAWWTQWDLYHNPMKDISEATMGVAAYIRETQAHQAEAYSIAANACKRRFPKCGGFIIWMGHDCFPCPANNSVIDFLCETKPAYHALREVFLS